MSLGATGEVWRDDKSVELITSENVGPIASIFWQNEEYSTGLGRDIHLDGVLCVVDAVFGQKVCLIPSRR